LILDGSADRKQKSEQDTFRLKKGKASMVEKIHTLAGKKIGMFGKGGAGKSTVTALLARALAEQGYEVYILDADSTNIGLHQALGIDHPPMPLLDYFGGAVFRGGQVTCPVDDPTPLPNAVIRWETLPENYHAQSSHGIRYLIAGKIGAQGPGAGCDGPVAKIARDVTIEGTPNKAVTLVDFKAGFEDSARGAITNLDWAVVVVDPTNAAIQMAVDMQHLVEQIQAGELPATEHLESPELVELANATFRNASIQGVLFVLNRVTSQQMEDYLRGKLEEHGLKPLGVIHADPAIAMAWLTGSTLESDRAQREIQDVVDKLEHAVVS
jgi:CO dehydrogenase maturation factor